MVRPSVCREGPSCLSRHQRRFSKFYHPQAGSQSHYTGHSWWSRAYSQPPRDWYWNGQRQLFCQHKCDSRSHFCSKLSTEPAVSCVCPSLNIKIPSHSCSTNSASSREYKNSRIEWVADECAQPLESLSYQTPAPALAPASTPTPEAKSETLPSRKNLMGNRFRVLNLSDTDGSNGDDSSDDTL